MSSTRRRTGQASAREKLLAYFLANLGKVIGTKELRAASGGISEYARRIRELRDEHGYQILTHRDRDDLKPGEYLLETAKRSPVLPRNISSETRALVLERNGYTCKMCGKAAGDPDERTPGRTVRLVIGHVIDKSKGGADDPLNLRAVCNNCNGGLSNAAPPKPKLLELMIQLRRSNDEYQRAAYEWLKTKFDRK